MMRSTAGLVLIAAILDVAAPPVLAGMPSPFPILTEAGKAGLQGISFFAGGLLLSAAFLRWIWNGLAGDFSRLPRLSYPKACGVVVLWGLLFVIVLTMISGARELMTPGAWKSNGLTYELVDKADGQSAAAHVDVGALVARTAALSALGEQLRQYAKQHDGRFPGSIEDSGFVAQRWTLPGPTGMQYKYVPGASLTGARSVLVAYEPNVFGDEPLALFADGRVMAMPIDVIVGMLPAEVRE